MDLCIVEQNDDAPAGLLAEWARERGHRVITLQANEIGAGPWPDPAALRRGSRRSGPSSPSTRSRDPWIAPQVAFLREAHDRGVPVLGICFGGQALAAALGGEVQRGARARDRLARARAARRRRRSRPARGSRGTRTRSRCRPGRPSSRAAPSCPHAFRVGRSVGLQFHPEVTPAIVEGWIRDGRDTLAAASAIDGDAMGAQTRAGAAAHRARAFALFDRDRRRLDGRSTDSRPNLSGRLKNVREAAR